MRFRYFRAILIALIWIIFQSATGGYIHGNSLGQMVANHMPLGGLFFLILAPQRLRLGAKSVPEKIELFFSPQRAVCMNDHQHRDYCEPCEHTEVSPSSS